MIGEAYLWECFPPAELRPSNQSPCGPTNMKPIYSLISLVTLFFLGEANADQPAAPSFEGQVRPILKVYCFDCHGEGEKVKGGLDLRLRRSIVAGGKTGPALIAEKPDDSLLFQRISEQQMPPTKKKLSKEEIEVIRRW